MTEHSEHLNRIEDIVRLMDKDQLVNFAMNMVVRARACEDARLALADAFLRNYNMLISTIDVTLRTDPRVQEHFNFSDQIMFIYQPSLLNS